MKILFTLVKEDYIDPMNVELLSAQAKMEGHETFLAVLEHNDFRDKVQSIRPDIVAYSAKTGESNVFFRANKWLKGTLGDRVISVMGGPHPTFNHMRMRLFNEELRYNGEHADPGYPIEETDLDILAVGEADEAWPALLRALAAGQNVDGIANLVTRTNRRMDGTVQLKDRTNYLDDLPFLDRELIYANTRLKDFGMRSFMASRGCPFICTYCFNAKFNQLYRGKGKTVNRYSVDRLLLELEDMVRRHPTQFIKFYDDVFTFRSDAWLQEFAEQYPRRIGLPFHCLTRADLVKRDPGIIDLLKKAGIHSISMSIESGNAFLREHVLKRGMNEEDIRVAFDLCRKQKIHTFSNTILAIPAPILPSVEDKNFVEKSRFIVEQLRDYFHIHSDRLPKGIDWRAPMPISDRHQLVHQLRELGLRGSAIEYDLDSVDINVTNRVVFGEFPELFPYPGTPITQYTMDVGAFDGNFEKLHQNYQSESPFSCFSSEDKLKQINLSLLALVFLVFPRARNFAVRHLLHRRWTQFYFFLYFLAKAYLVGTKIYPMKYSFRHIIRTIRESFFSEWLKHSKEEGENFFEKRVGSAQPASDVLGGPWQS